MVWRAQWVTRFYSISSRQTTNKRRTAAGGSLNRLIVTTVTGSVSHIDVSLAFLHNVN